MKNMTIGDIIQANTSEKINLGFALLGWWGWYTLLKSFYHDFDNWWHRKEDQKFFDQLDKSNGYESTAIQMMNDLDI